MHVRIFLLITVFCTTRLFAQTDTTLLLQPEKFSEKDILSHGPELQKRQSVSATRSVEDLDQLPYSVWVITAEDILRNGFVTLGDVLRAAPGIRVSQPGNALEGETFMMGGLSGNRYVKILINDVPIKPATAPGMPIGAQLPIRQAERIEVFYGPAAAIYGDGACAGVVNIILKETERPIFTQADLAFGNFGYNSIDLMLGGKLFKDQKIFRFSLFGSSTVRGLTDVFYDDRLYAPKNYLPFGLDSSVYRSNGNYRFAESTDSIARTAPLPHESRLLGIHLTFRGLRFTYHRMQRFDHSSLGLSPLAVSYANPSNRVAEQIETFALGFTRRRTKRSTSNTISVIRYKLDNTSSFTPVFDRLGAALYYGKLPDIQSDSQRAMVLRSIYDRYNSNERYFTANGLDVRIESRINVAIRPNLILDAGVQGNLGGGVPPMGYFPGPAQASLFGERDTLFTKPFHVESAGNLEANTFAQLSWQGKKVRIIGGLAANLYTEMPAALAPRLAMLYRLDSSWSVYANYSEGFRRPSVNERVNTYKISPVRVEAEPYRNNLTGTEQLRYGEFGIRRYGDLFVSQLRVFYQEARRLVRNGYLYPETEDNTWRYGYAQPPGLAMTMWGIQGSIGDDVLSFDLNRNKARPGASEITGRLEYYFQYTRGKEWFGYGLPAVSDVRNYPRWITQLRFSLRSRKWEFMGSANRHNGILGSAVVYRDFYQRQITETYYPAYRTWDFKLRVYLSNHFLLYLHVQNAFNKHFAGIDASGTADDLLYNPQPGRLVRFGVNYNMN